MAARTDVIEKLADQAQALGMQQAMNGNNNKSNAWQQAMMSAMAAKMNPSHLLGRFANKLLTQLYQDWKERYDLRGDLKADLQNKTPEEREKLLAEWKQRAPGRAAYIQENYDRWYPKAAQGNAGAQPTLAKDSTAWQTALRDTNGDMGYFTPRDNPPPNFGNQQDAINNYTQSLLGSDNPLANSAQNFSEIPSSAGSSDWQKLLEANDWDKWRNMLGGTVDYPFQAGW